MFDKAGMGGMFGALGDQMRKMAGQGQNLVVVLRAHRLDTGAEAAPERR